MRPFLPTPKAESSGDTFRRPVTRPRSPERTLPQSRTPYQRINSSTMTRCHLERCSTVV